MNVRKHISANKGKINKLEADKIPDYSTWADLDDEVGIVRGIPAARKAIATAIRAISSLSSPNMEEAVITLQEIDFRLQTLEEDDFPLISMGWEEDDDRPGACDRMFWNLKMIYEPNHEKLAIIKRDLISKVDKILETFPC